jgi:hypothetical protein
MLRARGSKLAAAGVSTFPCAAPSHEPAACCRFRLLRLSHPMALPLPFAQLRERVQESILEHIAASGFGKPPRLIGKNGAMCLRNHPPGVGEAAGLGVLHALIVDRQLIEDDAHARRGPCGSSNLPAVENRRCCGETSVQSRTGGVDTFMIGFTQAVVRHHRLWSTRKAVGGQVPNHSEGR